jgi:hypothetical protein
MALQTTKGLLLGSFAGDGNNYASMLLDAATEKAAFIIRVPKDGTLDSVGFLLGTVTQAPTNGLKISFQDVSLANGDPDGSVDQYAVVTAGLVSNAWIDVGATGYMGSTGTGSGTKRTILQGDYLAVVIEYQSFNAGDSLNIRNFAPKLWWAGNAYSDLYTGTWAKANAPVLSLKYDDGSYAFMPNVVPYSTASYSAINTGTTPDEIALKFKLPYSAKINGLWFYGTLAAGSSVDLILYAADGSTVLASASLDGDVVAGVMRMFWVPIAEITLTKDTFYYIAFKPTTTTSINLYWFTVFAAAIFDQLDLNQNAYWSQRTDAGAWTDTTTRRPFLGATISALDDGAGGGGAGISRGRLQGGM